MSRLELLRPRRYYGSLVAVDIHDLIADGVRGLIIDLDNTMVPRKESGVSEPLEAWLAGVRAAGVPVCIVSNNFKNRVAQVAARLGLPLVARAAKPRRKAFVRGMECLGTDRASTAVIGDQLFTDVLGGNRLGLYTVLVIPLPGPELPHTAILRRIERRLIAGWMERRRLKLEPGAADDREGEA